MCFEIFEGAFFVKGVAEHIGSEFGDARVFFQRTGRQEFKDAATTQDGAVFFGADNFHRARIEFHFGAQTVDAPTAKHEEMVVQVRAVIQFKKDVLAERVNVDDFAPDEGVGIFSHDAQNSFVVGIHGFDGFARERFIQARGGAFDFGTFGHDTIYTKGWDFFIPA